MKKQPRKREAGSLLEPHFTDEDKAREYLEAMRWPEGAVCPHCGLLVKRIASSAKKRPKNKLIEMLRARKRIRKAQKGHVEVRGLQETIYGNGRNYL